MVRASLFALLAGMIVVSAGGISGQEGKKDEKKKDEPAGKVKGFLPANFKKIGLSDSQTQDIYKIQAKYAKDIDELEAKVKELKGARDKEIKAVLTPEQKKRLEDIQTGKDKEKKDKDK
jgi:hypothetical protein